MGVHAYHESKKKKRKVGGRETQIPGVREGRKGTQGLMEEGEKVYVDQRDKIMTWTLIEIVGLEKKTEWIR